jgi:hypothetical protein
MVTPYTFFQHNLTRNWLKTRPDLLLINGTVLCRGEPVSVMKFVRFRANLDTRRVIEDHFCRPFLSNESSSDVVWSERECHHANESTDQCGEWDRCLSVSRIRDGWKDCHNGSDEGPQTEVAIQKSCALVQRHRVQCPDEQATCLSVTRIGDGLNQCGNGRDEHRSRSNARVELKTNVQFSANPSRNRSTPTTYGPKVKFLFVRIAIHSRIASSEKMRISRSANHTGSVSKINGNVKLVNASRRVGLMMGNGIVQMLQMNMHYSIAVLKRHFKKHLGIICTNRSYSVPSTCPQSQPFLCLSAKATNQGFSCFDLSQMGDGHIDCAGAQDERNTLQACSPSSILGYQFLCASTNHCIPYHRHCLTETDRCPNRLDEQHWCDRQHRLLQCADPKDFVCFNETCIRQGRCDWQLDCPFGEDEYMCDYEGTFSATLTSYRKTKEYLHGMKTNTLRFSTYPVDANIARDNSSQSSAIALRPNSSSSSFSLSTLSPYWCNRSLGVLTSRKNDSIRCFSPPQYYGQKCEYHADRLSVVLQLDLNQFTYDKGYHPEVLLKLVVLFVFKAEVLQRNQFHLHSSWQISDTREEEEEVHLTLRLSSFILGP